MNIHALLKKYHLRPRKGLGQNFLADPHHLAKIVEAAEISSQDTVLEIGPGLGTLTELLAQVAQQITAIELDPHMIAILKTELAHLSNLTLIEGDILETPLDTLLPLTYKVVANLPYYITSAILRHLLEATPQPKTIVVTLQKEVAQRIIAPPGQMSILAVSVQFYGHPRLMHHIPAGAFYPPPKVDSAVLRIDTFHQQPSIPADQFFRVVKAGFSQKRKQLKNSLAAALPYSSPEIVTWMEQANIDPTRRAETLSLVEWEQLARLIDSQA